MSNDTESRKDRKENVFFFVMKITGFFLKRKKIKKSHWAYLHT